MKQSFVFGNKTRISRDVQIGIKTCSATAKKNLLDRKRENLPRVPGKNTKIEIQSQKRQYTNAFFYQNHPKKLIVQIQ